MTSERDAASRVAFEADVVDAEFETIGNEMPRSSKGYTTQRMDAQASCPGPDAGSERGGMDVLRREADASGVALGRRGGLAFWSGGITLAAAAFWISGGHTLAGPVLSAFATKHEPLRIAELSSRVESLGGRKLLIIDGAVVNQGRKTSAVPPLLIEVTGDAGRVTRYTLDTAGAGIAPGAEVRFSSRVDVPIGGVAGVSVKMSERSD